MSSRADRRPRRNLTAGKLELTDVGVNTTDAYVSTWTRLPSMSDRTAAQPRRRISKEARRVKLLAAAEAVFEECGYGGATMELVAARAGVARSLLYDHFSSLEDLYVECVRAARAELDARLLGASISHQGHPREQLRAGIMAYFQFVSERGASWEILAGTGSAPDSPAGVLAAQLRFQTAEQIAALFSQAVPEVAPDDARAYAHVVSGGGEQLARWWRHNPDTALNTVVDRIMTVVWDGLCSLVPDEPTSVDRTSRGRQPGTGLPRQAVRRRRRR